MQISSYRNPRASSTVATSAVDAHPAAPETKRLLEYRRRFALAIGKPSGNALLIDANNQSIGWVSIDTAITREAAFAVELREDILAGDSDRPDNGASVWQLVGDLRHAGHHPVLVASGQVGRFHVLVRIAHQKEREHFAERARDLGLDVRHCLRPPLVPHRLGLQPRLLDPSEPEAALQALRPTGSCEQPSPHRQYLRDHSNGPAIDAPRSDVAERCPHGNAISAHMQRLLEQGDKTGRYQSRSEVIQALALAAVNANWSYDRFFHVLMDARHAGGEKIQALVSKRGIRDACLYAHRCWLKAGARAAASPSFRDGEGARAVIDMIERQADQCDWSGKARSTDRAVLQAHLELARKLGSLTYGASDRLTAERAGVTFPTANKSHKRLSAGGWLQRAALGRGPRASTWRLRLPQGRNRNTRISSGGCVDEC